MLCIGYDAGGGVGGGGIKLTNIVWKKEGVACSKVYTVIGVKGTRKR